MSRTLTEEKDWFRETDHELQELRQRVARLERFVDWYAEGLYSETEPLPWGDLD